MLEYIIKNELHVVFVQDIFVFLVVGFFSGIKEKKSYFLWSLFLTIILTIFYTQINLLATGLLWLSSVILAFAYLKK